SVELNAAVALLITVWAGNGIRCIRRSVHRVYLTARSYRSEDISAESTRRAPRVHGLQDVRSPPSIVSSGPHLRRLLHTRCLTFAYEGISNSKLPELRHDPVQQQQFR